MKKLMVLASSFLLTMVTMAITAKTPTVHSPQIEIQNYQKQTSKPKRKISIQFSLLTSTTPSARHLNSLIHKLLKAKRQEFIKSSSESMMNFTSTLQINDSILFYKPKKLISIQYEQNSYISGAAHPNTTHFVINYDIVSGKLLKLQDVLNNPKADLNFIANVATKKLKSKKLGKMNFIKEGASPTFKNYRNWNFTDKGLLIVFDTYQVAAYVYGPQKILISYSTLNNHIKPRYFQMLQNKKSQ